MPLPELTLSRPRSLAEALILARAPGARVVAGGTGLMPNLRAGVEAPRTLVSLQYVPELRSIVRDQGAVRIGACVTLQTIVDDEALPVALREAARSIGAPAHRFAGTVGGNLCLDTRCLYYNQSEGWRASNGYCLKRGGDICHVAPKGKVCRAAFSGDLAPALLALDAELETTSGSKPLAQLYRDDGAQPLTLAAGEIVTALRLPVRNLRSGYAKARRRGAIDFPLAGVAMALSADHLRVALTGTNACPLLIEGTAPGMTPAALAKLVQKQVKPLRTTIGAADYRRQVAAVLARRLLARLTNDPTEGESP